LPKIEFAQFEIDVVECFRYRYRYRL